MIRKIFVMASLGLYLAANHALAQTTTENAPVTDCDTYGANSVDPQRKTPGVNFVELNAAVALPACEAAAQQYPDSTRFMYQLGRAYHKANRFADAAAWYQKAMEHSSAFAEAGLALLYLYGQGMTQDYSKAATMFRDAADKGVLGAQNVMGILYSNGWGVPQDEAQALVWYRKAADQGVNAAKKLLGDLETKRKAQTK